MNLETFKNRFAYLFNSDIVFVSVTTMLGIRLDSWTHYNNCLSPQIGPLTKNEECLLKLGLQLEKGES